MDPCSPWDCHSIPTLALQYLSGSLGFCSCVQGAPERSSAPLPHVPASSSLQSRREQRRADGEGSTARAGWHQAQWACTAGHREDGVLQLLAALCGGEGNGGPVGGYGMGDAVVGSRGLSSICTPEWGPGLLPAPGDCFVGRTPVSSLGGLLSALHLGRPRPEIKGSGLHPGGRWQQAVLADRQSPGHQCPVFLHYCTCTQAELGLPQGTRWR